MNAERKDRSMDSHDELLPAALSKWTTNRAGRLMAKWALAALSVRAILISNYLT